MRTVRVVDDELSAVVLLGSAQEQRRGDVGANPLRRVADLTDRIVDVYAERLTARIAVE
jgi:hypothetical protein